jgi:hypothetical protein
MDLMYLSTLDLPGSLISESRTSPSSSSQVSMDLSTCTDLIHSHPTYVWIIYTTSLRMYAPYSQTTRVHVLTLYTDSPRTPQKIGFFVFVVILRISSSTLRATSDIRHFICIHKYLQ